MSGAMWSVHRELMGQPKLFPYLNGKSAEQRREYFLEDPGRMRGHTLGGCLDSLRWGTMSTCVFPGMDVADVVEFVRLWTEQNEDIFLGMLHEKKLEDLYKKFELPHIRYDKCPRHEGHAGTVEDMAGRTRCAHKSIQYHKEGFYRLGGRHYDKHSRMMRMEVIDATPTRPVDVRIDANEDEEMMHQQALGDYYRKEDLYNAAPTVKITDLCYAILDDTKLVLSMEDILDRLRYERCGRHYGLGFEVPCDGWDLAYYVQRWYEQLPGEEMPPFNE